MIIYEHPNNLHFQMVFFSDVASIPVFWGFRRITRLTPSWPARVVPWIDRTGKPGWDLKLWRSFSQVRWSWYVWRFLEIGLPPNHPFLIWFSIRNHPFGGPPNHPFLIGFSIRNYPAMGVPPCIEVILYVLKSWQYIWLYI